MLKVSGVNAFSGAVEAWLSGVEKMAEDSAKGIAYKMLRRILYTSPQYSGDFVANWNVSYGQPDTSFKVGAVKPITSQFGDGGVEFKPYKMGDSPAIEYALSKAAGKLSGFKLGKPIYLTNMSGHADRLEGGGAPDMYSWKIELGQIKLRPVNRGAFYVVSRAAVLVSMQYKSIGTGNYSALAADGAKL